MFKRNRTKNCLNQEQIRRTTVLRFEFAAANFTIQLAINLDSA